MLRSALFAVALVAASGCLVPQKLNSPEERKAAFVAQPDHAALILFMDERTNASVDVIDEDNRCLAFLTTGNFFGAQLTPGRHQIIVLSKDRTTYAIVAEVAAGKTYFLRTKAGSGKDGPELEPIRPGSTAAIGLDYKLQNMTSLSVDPSRCAKHLADLYPGWEDLIAKTKATVANAQPTLGPAHGIVWKGTVEKAD
jgi:hypothetical protein